ncbi:hypothetical protein ABB37_03536 [Leptomonas pyrrhocoris]|uniref:Sfi1 spindle body domain-containing protein n=1 Tax=Leptomonas pyrrhocoris TaxID=157538 RepID=A0A0M9G561_LEPPY|nr:hypothetical protein ABB37_03536 [Leptomonas pyrrhocoris]KPA82477.1 hypothetical protein ABB37_03536 [Leptomonas pyrrhocoris]|eukprot:XP_015660916.1 hypothetical protein ABB37_03536 [Leptomonas pyrrhocoris]
MNLSSTAWIRQPDDFYVIEELRHSHYDEHGVSYNKSSRAHSTITSVLEPSARAVDGSRGDTFPTRKDHETHLTRTGRFLKGRSRRDVLGDLQCIRAEANTLVLRRLLLRWGLYAVRRSALRQLQQDTLHVLWQRLGGRCFAWWRLLTERRLCREALYQEAEIREASFLRDFVCRTVWGRWQQWARTRGRRRDRAFRLSLVNRQRHALLRFCAWCCYPRQCAVLRHLQCMRFAAERRLVRFFLVQWRSHTLQRFLAFPLEVKAAQQVAVRAFRAWKRRALIGAYLHRTQQEALWSLGVRCFGRWKRWLRRRLQAALLQRANETRLLLHIFTQWAWKYQLGALSISKALT